MNGAPGPIPWIRGRPVPLDHGGPEDVPFEPLPAGGGLGFDAVARAAARRPDKVAVTDGTLSLSYAELLDRAQGLAAALGGRPAAGEPIASLIANGPAATCALLAVIGAGGVYVPADPGHPPERQRRILEQSGARLLLMEAGFQPAEGVVPPEMEVLRFDPRRPAGAPPLPDPAVAARARFVTFTSGTTGAPKGLAFAADPAIVADFVARFHLNPDDVFVSLASMSQTGAADLIALTVGAGLVVIDIRRTGIGEGLKAFRAAGVTVLSFVPTALRALMAVPGIEGAFERLRVLDLHGESILWSDLRLFRSKLPPDCRISVTYGTTETGIVFTWFPPEAPEDAEGPAPVGYLAPDKAVALLGPDGAPAAPGEAGELLVRGRLALGSWREGRTTPARFLPDPDGGSERLYLTGDLFRRRPDGLFEFLGRKDRQVKIRGLWVDLAEVERALVADGEVDDAAAVVRRRPGENDAVAAVVAPAPGASVDAARLRRLVAERCAEHMVPARVVVVDALPRLPNLKPDLAALERLAAD